LVGQVEVVSEIVEERRPLIRIDVVAVLLDEFLGDMPFQDFNDHGSASGLLSEGMLTGVEQH
jgi:hypothetical protein